MSELHTDDLHWRERFLPLPYLPSLRPFLQYFASPEREAVGATDLRKACCSRATRSWTMLWQARTTC